jgi:NADPH:quinone reductase-like Zn-dependent oxidoreductase
MLRKRRQVAATELCAPESSRVLMPDAMKAIICTRYGPPEVLQLAEVPRPVPFEHEVQIRIHATSCHIGDVRVRGALLPVWLQLPFRLYMGILKPKRRILGMEFAGVVEAVGKAVRRFKTGDAVLASSPFLLGGYAEYICVHEDARDIRKGLVVHKPTAMNFAEAAAGLATGGLTALSMLRKADVRPGRKVLVYGASGSVGVYAVQLAKYFGAEVTGVCSTGNLALVRSLGASNVIDYTGGELETCTHTFDVVLDAVGKLPAILGRKLTARCGQRLDVRKHVGPVSKMTTAELQFLAALVEAGELHAFIDREYPMERIVEAHTYVQQGHKRGHVIINVNAAS